MYLKLLLTLAMFSTLLQLFGCSGNKGTKNSSNKPKADSLSEQISKRMEDFKNRPIYKELTVDIIDKTSDENLVRTVLDNLEQKFLKDYSNEYETIMSLSKSRQAIYVIWELEAEVNNGGFNQFYFNSSRQFSRFAPDALKLVGANKFAELTTRANKIYQEQNEKITKEQDGTLNGFKKSYKDNPLNDVDKEFYKLYETEKLIDLEVAYIRKNKTEFIDK